MEGKSVSPTHLGYLDSARGIAALMVMIYHYITWKYGYLTGARLAAMVFNGSDAVSFFFVLSGFVLSYKYVVLNQSLDIRKFYINRLFRLWPAYFVTVLINTINCQRHDLSLHNMVNVFVFNKALFWEEAFIFRGNANYFGAGWTLVLEMAFSFYMPFAIALAKKDTRLVYWMLFAYLIIGNSLRDLYFFHIHFTLGLLISCLFFRISDPSFQKTNWYRYRYPVLFIAVVLFSVRHIDKIIPLGASYAYIAKYFGIDFFLYTGIASFVFLVAIVRSEKVKAVLEHKLLRFFGKISYGIYLMHWLFVVDIYWYWDKIRSWFPNTVYAFAIMFFIYSFLTISAATLLHYYVEMPFIKLGKRITARMKPSYQIT